MDQVHEIEQVEEKQAPSDKITEQRLPMTYTEFLESFDESTHAEWANGEAIVFMPPTIRHQDLVTFLVALLATFVKAFDLGKVLAAPCEMRLETTGTSREPDILFVAEANRGRISEKRIDGPADLVIEIISNESVARDRGDKFYEYQANGVREYWIIDPRPTSTRADFWVLDEDGRYRPVPIEPDGIYRSTILPNFKLNVNSLLADELPDPLKALADMVGIEPLLRVMGHDQ
ncbi:MAG: Uma2 family endonuclease [Caldilineaceae bacterium]|nr:Uma2 family endonuclease [Caldilineaceae bacterium]